METKIFKHIDNTIIKNLQWNTTAANSLHGDLMKLDVRYKCPLMSK
jgi:hypothetical protein